MADWQPLPGPFGAVCRRPAAELAPDALNEALARYQLLVLRDQTLDPSSFTELARRLGEPLHYPYAQALPEAEYVVPIVKTPADRHNFGGAWHSDSSYLEAPPATTLLLARQLPASGGDTLFASSALAYEHLSDAMKHALGKLSAINTSALVHAAGGAYASVAGDAGHGSGEPQTAAVHPLVRRHPESGRCALYLNLVHTERCTGMSRAESLPLLEFLQARIIAAENCVRLCWEPGTLAIWDNRTLQHLPLNDYPGERREMHRIILAGERPEGPLAPERQRG